MKTAPGTTASISNAPTGTTASIATEELRLRIRAGRLGEALSGFASDLCLEEVPVEEAFQRLQDRAMERMVSMLDASILGDDEAMRGCLELVARESEKVAWQALEKGTEDLHDCLDVIDGLEVPHDNGYVN